MAKKLTSPAPETTGAVGLARIFLLCCLAMHSALAGDTNTLPGTITVDGITYSNVTWRTVTPATVSIFHQTGVASIPLEKLPSDLQRRFGYDPVKAVQYRAAEQTERQKLADEAAARRTLQTGSDTKRGEITHGQQDNDNSAQAQPDTKQGEIAGAFGLTLGAQVDLSSLQKTRETTDKIPMYGFMPDNPVQGLTKYYFQVTPKTGLIYCIWAIGDCESTPACVKQQAVLIDILEKKYGHQEEKGLMDTLRDSIRILKGRRSIIAKCSGIDGLQPVTVNLYYIDSDLQEQAEKERIELEGRKIDGSGL
jgi:hypothetical protein